MLRTALVIAALAGAIPQAAMAEWRYCLAPSDKEHKVYLSSAFATTADAWSTDNSFEKVLERDHLQFDDVQCPRADDEGSIIAMLQHAVGYNREIGRKIVFVQWQPALVDRRRN